MKIGVPKEIKNHEYRIGMTPAGVYELVENGHRVMIQKGGGEAIGLLDQHYIDAGATIADTPAEIFEQSDMIIKVKEPQPNECKMLREDQILFTFLHLAPDPTQTKLLKESGCTAIAYETVTDGNGRLPILIPMSEVAGRLSIQAGASCMEKSRGGEGILLGGVPGVLPAQVTVLGGGVVGLNAARMAAGLGADITIIDRSLSRLAQIDELFDGRIKTLYSNKDNVMRSIQNADLVVGSVLIPGATAPKLVTRKMLKDMNKKAVFVDVAIDQGGCFETSVATTHDNPTYIDEGLTHYCVANMPGGVAKTSTFALTNATLPFVNALANKGWKEALADDSYLLAGLNVHKGNITFEAVARDLGYDYLSPESALKI